MDNEKSAGCVVFHSDCGIYGYGPTLDAALRSAAEWAENDPEILNAVGVPVRQESGRWYFAPATAALLDRVAQVGNCAFELNLARIACLPPVAE